MWWVLEVFSYKRFYSSNFVRNAVYQINAPVIQTIAPVVIAQSAVVEPHKADNRKEHYVSDSKYLGCFIDTDIRLLPTQHSTSGSDLTEACYQAAKANNDNYFGTQYGHQCFSGKRTILLTTYGKVNDSECSYACGTGPKEASKGKEVKCGAAWRASVYEIKDKNERAEVVHFT